MTVRADWGTAVAEPDQPASTPDFGPSTASESEGMKPIDLTTDAPALEERLVELLRQEGDLYNCGITCPLKEMSDGNCSVCPVTRAHETSGSLQDIRMAKLCRIGAEQERVAMALLVKRHRGV